MRLAGVIAIVWLHAYLWGTGWRDAHGGDVVRVWAMGLMRWGMPFLGCLSGYLFFRGVQPTRAWFLGKYRRRFHSLVVPFLLWSTLGIAYAAAAELATGDYSGGTSALEALRALPFGFPVWGQLWFLQGLITCVAVSPVVYLGVRRACVPLLLATTAWWIFGQMYFFDAPWLAAGVLLPFSVGAAAAVRGWRAPRPSAPVVAGLTAAWVGAAALFATFGLGLGYATLAGQLVVAALGVAAVWCLADVAAVWLRRHPRLTAAVLWAAPFAFFVYVSQNPLLELTHRYVTLRLPAASGSRWLEYVLQCVVDVVFALVLGGLLRWRLPRTFAFLTGGRRLLWTGRRPETAPAAAPRAGGEAAAGEGGFGD